MGILKKEKKTFNSSQQTLQQAIERVMIGHVVCMLKTAISATAMYY